MACSSKKSDLGTGSVIGITVAVLLAPILFPFVILLCILALVAFLLWVAPDSFGKDYKIVSQETIAVCSSGAEMKKVNYDIAGGDIKESLVYYTFGDKKILLDGQISNGFIEANPDQGYENSLKYSTFKEYSYIPLIQKDEVVVISERQLLDRRNIIALYTDLLFELGDGGADALFVNSDEIPRERFDQLIYCLKEFKDKNFDGSSLPLVVGYQPSNSKSGIYTPSIKTSVLQYQCQSPNIKLNVGLNGRVYLSDIPNEYALYGMNFETNIDIQRLMTNSAQFNLGYMRADGKIRRHPRLDPTYKARDKNSGYLPLREFPFEKVRKEIKIISLIFDENQNPINDYLEKCNSGEENPVFFGNSN